jgi:hypothetical protein
MLSNKVVAITGAGGVICSAFAKELAKHGAKVALLDISTREFPTEVYITDAEFVYRGDYYGIIPDNEPDLPYFYHSLPEGLYVGISKRKKHFNRPCRIHVGI